MKNKLIAATFGLTALFLGILTVPTSTFAMQPTLVLSNQGNNSVLISSYGDANSAVTLYYANSGSNGSYTSVGSIGWTNQSGTFSTTLNYNSYNIGSGAAIYVIVNGQQSPITYWPSNSNCYNYNYNCDTNYNYNNNYGTITLSQTNLTVNQGDTRTVTIYYNSNNNGYNYNNSYYVSNNTSSNIANVTVSGNALTIRGNNPGTATFTICGYNNAGCTTLSVTVQQNYSQYPYNQYNNQYSGYQYVYLSPTSGQYNNNALIFQPGTISVKQKQSQSFNLNSQAYIYNPAYPNYSNSTYYVSNNSTTKAAQVTISNNTLYVQGLKKGNSTVTICRTDNYCGTISVKVTK